MISPLGELHFWDSESSTEPSASECQVMHNNWIKGRSCWGRSSTKPNTHIIALGLKEVKLQGYPVLCGCYQLPDAVLVGWIFLRPSRACDGTIELSEESATGSCRTENPTDRWWGMCMYCTARLPSCHGLGIAADLQIMNPARLSITKWKEMIAVVEWTHFWDTHPHTCAYLRPAHSQDHRHTCSCPECSHNVAHTRHCLVWSTRPLLGSDKNHIHLSLLFISRPVPHLHLI